MVPTCVLTVLKLVLKFLPKFGTRLRSDHVKIHVEVRDRDHFGVVLAIPIDFIIFFQFFYRVEDFLDKGTKNIFTFFILYYVNILQYYYYSRKKCSTR